MTLSLDEVYTHDKAIRAVARQLKRNEWGLAATYAALQGHAVTQPLPTTQLVRRMLEQGYEECVPTWTIRDRQAGTPLLSPSPGRLVYIRAMDAGSIATPVLLARYVYYRSLDIGGMVPYVKLFVVLGPRWREIMVRTAAIHGLTARTVGPIQHISGMLAGRKYTSVRMDWI